MCFSRSGYFGLAASVLLALDGTGSLAADAGKLLSVDEIISRAVARAQQAQANAGQSGYTYTKLTVTEELDSTGRVKERKEKVYQVVFQAGATHLKLLTVNGRSPAQADVKKQSENDENARDVEDEESDENRHAEQQQDQEQPDAAREREPPGHAVGTSAAEAGALPARCLRK